MERTNQSWLSLLQFGMITCLLVMVPLTLQAQESSNTEDTSVQQKERIQELRRKQQLFEQELKQELQDIQAEQKRLEERYNLMMKKQQNKLAKFEKKKKKLDAEQAVESAEHRSKLAETERAIERLRTRIELSQTESDSALQSLREKKSRINERLELEELEKRDELSEKSLALKEQQLKGQIQQARATTNEARRKNMEFQHQLELAELKFKKSRMEAQIDLNRVRDQYNRQVIEPIDYRQDPVIDGNTLLITDRRIDLNGPILSSTGEWVSDRLHYFNNQSTDRPIFIAIEDSPGGSVMAGFRIVKTMNSIEAPVYVVVQERAMSMAAGITAHADRSFTFPNAMLLHHEIRASMGGSLTETEEGLELMQSYWKRVATPVAERMDMSLEEFRDRLYEENSNGNWREFGTEAEELNWVDEVVTNIEDASVRNEPSNQPPSPSLFFLDAEDERVRQDQEGNYYRKLPPLRPNDFYFLYNPENYYRW